MNTVILVSVLCTLGVVAILASIVVAFMKLNRKVDVIEQENGREFGRVYDYIQEQRRELENSLSMRDRAYNEELGQIRMEKNEEFRSIYNDFERYRDDVDRRFDECHSFVDSRCDKLDNKICGKNCKCKPTEKQLLTD
jgi:hypothetical protein